MARLARVCLTGRLRPSWRRYVLSVWSKPFRNGALAAKIDASMPRRQTDAALLPVGGRAALDLAAACCGHRAWLVVTKVHACGRLSNSARRFLLSGRGSREVIAGPWPGAAAGSGRIGTRAHSARHTPSLRRK